MSFPWEYNLCNKSDFNNYEMFILDVFTKTKTLKILIRYKKRPLSSISLFLKVKWPSDSIKSGQLHTKCFGFGKYITLFGLNRL